MDRRTARRVILHTVEEIETYRNSLEATVQDIDRDGDPILSGELRSRLDKLTDWLDAMYVWGGNI